MSSMRTVVSVAWVGLVGFAVGCSNAPPVKRAPVAAAVAAPRTVDTSGVWDWMHRSNDEQGDMRLEQEEWHLVQAGTRIDGYYDRAVTMMSSDDRLFRCNQRLGFTKLTRVHVSGQMVGNRLILRETRYETSPGPCDDGARQLVEYTGVVRGESLALRWGPDAGQTLVRRSPDATAGNQIMPAQLASWKPQQAARPTGGVSVPVDGDWEWELRSIDAEGDERLEREVWHLAETSDGVRGHYERTVRRIRGGGVFSCNQADRFETVTRYEISGQRFGEKVSLTESAYKVQPSPCDNGLRRLDTYQGHVADSDSLVLSWGPGNQLLRRKK